MFFLLRKAYLVANTVVLDDAFNHSNRLLFFVVMGFDIGKTPNDSVFQNFSSTDIKSPFNALFSH